ncbi:hypothetical protein LTR37_001361 [Vermiconidia calcicola]|uniref:Uncharacterized protein n=1 Tax=Vermiconidia calcicola TaxID=1690605 RepID=A0ACC3NVV6_9PEZI|nr:hypothetical protein LTR37_001361 [Vermiconidia calcicola]
MSKLPGTAAWLRSQWSNPKDIFTILFIVGGEIVQVAIAQLCAGPVPNLTPVSFSFGWLGYAVSALKYSVGEATLMPKPEVECMLINADTGYARRNYSWVLSRMLRDFDYWRPPVCDEEEAQKLRDLQQANSEAWRVYKDMLTNGQGCKAPADPGRRSHWSACDRVVMRFESTQLGIAAIPWGIWGEWLTFWVTGAGTILAYTSGCLPQWQEEKVGVGRLKYTERKKERKDVILTEGNGAHDAILIIGCENCLDLEALVTPQRTKSNEQFTRWGSGCLAVLWVALLISVAGSDEHTWFLLGVGMLGALHNIFVAGIKRKPNAFGFDLHYEATLVEGKVMEVLWEVEKKHPKAGIAMLPVFFPGKRFPRERLLWEYAEWRSEQVQKLGRETVLQQWVMPSLRRPESALDDADIRVKPIPIAKPSVSTA